MYDIYNIALNNNYSLDHYKIKNESNLFVVLRLRGGGGDNTFTSLNSVGEELIFSENAPKWRQVSHGFCLNNKCKAFKCEVIYARGFHDFELNTDKKKVCCPMCNNIFIPVSCGFYNCEYSYTEYVMEDLIPKIFFKEWTKVQNKFLYFDGNKKK